jgi:hypothetical protein
MKRSRKLTGTRARKSLKRISKKKIFMKRGGGVEDDILRKVETLRQQDGDFDDQQQLKELTGAELVAKMRSLRNAPDGSVSLGEAAKFGKELINARRISAYTDELIKELFATYDINSIKELILSSDPMQLNLQEFLPRHMIQTFGGDLSNWVVQKMSSNVFPPSSKQKLTQRDLPMIQYAIQNILKKYPEIDMRNENTQQFIIKDLLKKIYYLNEINKSENPTMNGGSPFSTLLTSSGLMVILYLTINALTRPYVKMERQMIEVPRREKSDKEYLEEARYKAKMRRAKPLSQYPVAFYSIWDGYRPMPELGDSGEDSGWFNARYDKNELDDFFDLKIDDYLQKEAKLQNEYDDDIQKMQQGIKPTSKNYLTSEEIWKPRSDISKHFKYYPFYPAIGKNQPPAGPFGLFNSDRYPDKTPEYQTAIYNNEYRDAFIGSKVNEYLALEPTLLANKRDKKISRAVFSDFHNY